jgi:NADP-dependent 3-hydroxy acid dehydrogenase YdfG
MERQKFMDQSPQVMQEMIRTNIRPYVLFTKYGTLHFKEHAHTHTNKVAMIHTASIASDLCTPWGGVYSGTKRYNEVFADLSSRQSKKSFDYKNLMVTQILKPGVVTTGLAYWKKGFYTSSTEECVSGSLANLGLQKSVYGSMNHNWQGMLLAPFLFNRAIFHVTNLKGGKDEEDAFLKM